MRARILKSKLEGSIKIPPSKSMSHRAIILGSLSKGRSIITNVLFSDDIIATTEAMISLGAKIEAGEDSLIIDGIENFQLTDELEIDCNESGSTLRFLIPIVSLFNTDVKLLGRGRLLKRPQSVYQTIFDEQNLEFIHTDDFIKLSKSLKPGVYEVAGDVSSQFITGLLFTLPFLNGDSVIKIRPPFESASYVKLTLELMEKFGAEIIQVDDLTFEIKGNQNLKSYDYQIEGDYSQIAFFAVAGAINNDLDCIGVSHDSSQGDSQIVDILKNAGCNVEMIDNGYRFKKSNLVGSTIDLADCPDLGPILTVMAACAKGTTTFINAERLRIKESDRIEAMEENLRKLGVDITSTDNTMTVVGGISETSDTILSSFKDHRIAMSLAIIGSTLENPIIINDAEVVSKSYPNFYEDYEKINGRVEKLD